MEASTTNSPPFLSSENVYDSKTHHDVFRVIGVQLDKVRQQGRQLQALEVSFGNLKASHRHATGKHCTCDHCSS
jgi:hypothetical protein